MRPHFTSPVDSLDRSDCETLIKLALLEDAPNGDPTSEGIFSKEQMCTASVISREPGVMCGASLTGCLTSIFFELTGMQVNVLLSLKDGDRFEKGSVLMKLSGSIPAMLRLERILLNFLQYLSGIATVTANCVAQAPAGVFILDTRKTLPGYRRLAKYAVFMGGGTNHRIHLSEMAMMKDNHIAAAGGIASAARNIRARFPGLPVEIEVDRIEQIEEALGENPKVILLDNMNGGRIREAIKVIRAYCDRTGTKPPIIEVSGGWTPARLPELAGLDLPVGVSMGFLTHTTRFLDLSLEIA
ncbi:MAG: carboxylating nicotinate-nucleotide diphosphorylase [Leptospirales bacterium]|nr:carboxylating nicotinate-nucleotide diphosphorylase [Leptospirales bacterium]